MRENLGKVNAFKVPDSIMSNFMCLQSTSMRECFQPHAIFIVFSSCGNLFMCLETISWRECFRTCYALKSFNTCMSPIMYNEITFLRVKLSSVITEIITISNSIQFCLYNTYKYDSCKCKYSVCT